MAKAKEYTLTRYACYVTNVSMAAVANLSPLLFVTFREMYGISYTLLGLLVVINFSTQLTIDLIFTLFSKHFNIHKTIRTMPAITVTGLIIYGVLPRFFPDSAYLWISLGTVVFSIAAGLNEVLVSPIIAAIPADNPEREMSKLHSTYAWGVVGVVIISTLFLKVVGRLNWMYLALLWALIPLSGFVMFLYSKLPDMTPDKTESKKVSIANLGIMLCCGCIFLGGAAECTMTQWVSGFAEKAVGIPKLWGDIFGMALFASLLGAGRTLYSKYGKNIANVMLFGMAGAVVCYVVAGLCLNPIVCLVACVITGLCVYALAGNTYLYRRKLSRCWCCSLCAPCSRRRFWGIGCTSARWNSFRQSRRECFCGRFSRNSRYNCRTDRNAKRYTFIGNFSITRNFTYHLYEKIFCQKMILLVNIC